MSIRKECVSALTKTRGFLDGDYRLFNHYLSSWRSFAGKPAGCYLAEGYNAVFGGVNGELFAHKSARAGNFGLANLTNQNLASANFLAAKALNAQPLTGRIVYVLTCTTCFDV